MGRKERTNASNNLSREDHERIVFFEGAVHKRRLAWRGFDIEEKSIGLPESEHTAARRELRLLKRKSEVRKSPLPRGMNC